MFRKWYIVFSVIAVAILVQIAVTAENSAPGPQFKRITTETLGGPERYLTHISTDKPIYRGGERIYMRAVLLQHRSQKPLSAGQGVHSLVEIKGPKGDSVASGFVVVQDSVLGYQWDVPADQAGGEYTIKVSYPQMGFPAAERKFDVRNYRAPRLKSQINFLRKGYGPGDEVAATLNVERAEGGYPAGAKVTVVGRVDGAEVYRGKTNVNDEGQCLARFSLPDNIERGEGSLAMVIEDGGIVETASKTIPILLQTVDLSIYPEGGDLVAGLPGRVYFEALTPAKKPADIAGVIVGDQDKIVAEFRSEHEGRGRFKFTPRKDRSYHLRITEPSGIDTTFPLPKTQESGVSLRAKKDVFRSSSIQLAVMSSSDSPLWLTVSKREQELVRKQVKSPSAQKWSTIKLPVSEDVSGVLTATVWSAEGKPLAERLVFRQPQHAARVKITPNQPRYVPGGKVAITVETVDEKGKPISAVVGLSVTDDSVLEMIDKREQAPRLPVMVLLENDVRDLADAHVYLDPKNENAPLSLDLLLGVQGWRRFALVNSVQFFSKHGDRARRALALRMVTNMELQQLAESFVDDAFDLKHVRNEANRAVQKGLPVVPADAEPQEPNIAPPEAPQEAKVDEDPVADLQLAPAIEMAEPSPNLQVPRSRRQNELAEALDVAPNAELPFGSKSKQIRNDFMLVRVYSHQARKNRTPGERIDFTETLFWHAGLKTDTTGKATFEFDLSDSVTGFRVSADVFDQKGRLGTGSQIVESVEPFYVEPKLPLSVTAGDQILAPMSLINETSTGLEASVEWVAPEFELDSPPISAVTIAPSERIRRLASLRVGDTLGESLITLSAKAGAYSDTVTRKIVVQPRGFPVEVGLGGLVQGGETMTHSITIPEDAIIESLKARAVVYPTPLASMTESLQRLIREPSGCFEQTSSTTYPLVMAQQYFMSHQGVDPSLVERSAQTLDKGYKRLLGFESPSGGFEWFGGDPGHDALTAYGLMEFTDMSQVHAVDPAMLKRTRQWLLDQRDGKGGYTRRTRTLHTWNAEPEVANTYNTWALLEAGVDADLSREVDWVENASRTMQNTYALALAANVLALAERNDAANQALDKLAGFQQEDGSLDGATTSVVGSGGVALQIETTSLATTAWLTNSSYTPQVEKAIKYLADNCKAGRFGSTQSTILALRAIVAYDQSRANPKAPGTLQLVVDGKAVGQPVPFTADTQGAIELPDFSQQLTAGEHQVQLTMHDGSIMPYSIAVDYHRLKLESSRDCQLYLEVNLRDEKIEEGTLTEALVTIVSRAGEKLPAPMAIIGVPGGLEVDHDQLKELVKEEKIAAYEVIGREVILYWRGFAPEQRVEVPIRLLAAIPGTYSGPASRTYLYYTDELKTWVDGFQVEITPK